MIQRLFHQLDNAKRQERTGKLAPFTTAERGGAGERPLRHPTAVSLHKASSVSTGFLDTAGCAARARGRL